MTIIELREMLQDTCRLKTQKAYARELGISHSYLNQVVRGVKAPGSKILRALGLAGQMMFYPIGSSKLTN